MRYMLLIYDREADWAKLNEKDQGALYGEEGGSLSSWYDKVSYWRRG